MQGLRSAWPDSAAFAAAAPAAVLWSQLFPALRHEVFNEPGRAPVFTALQAWLTARFGRA